VSRPQLERRLANMPPRLIDMEACAGTRYVAQKVGIASGISLRLTKDRVAAVELRIPLPLTIYNAAIQRRPTWTAR
jgi:hypothetical protein